jgi:hypothetical protein
MERRKDEKEGKMRGGLMTMRIGGWLFAAALLFGACGSGEGDASREAEAVVLQAVMDLDSLSIGAFMAAGTPAILEFGGKRCISCMQMRDNLEELRDRYPALRVGYVYWEDSPELFGTWDIGVIPVQVLLDADGREQARHVGVWEVEEMAAALTRVLPREPSH